MRRPSTRTVRTVRGIALTLLAAVVLLGGVAYGVQAMNAKPDFGVSASPSSQVTTQGNSAVYTLTLTPSGGFAGSVSLSVSGLPSGATATFTSNPVSITSPSAGS